MQFILDNADELVQGTWIPGVGLRTPDAAKPTGIPESASQGYPIAISAEMYEQERAVFVVPETNEGLRNLLREAAREAASKKPVDDEEDAEEPSANNRKALTVDPYNARTNQIKGLFDATTGYIPKDLSGDAHALQVQLLDAFFSPSGPLAEHSQTVASSTGPTKRTSLFFDLAKQVSQNISSLVADTITTWKFDIVKVKTGRSFKYKVDKDKFPNAKFGDWNPLVPIHRAVFIANGERCTSFVAEIMREKRDNAELNELFQTPFYAELLPRLSQIRDAQVDNEESRAKDAPTTTRVRTKQCDERRAYPVLGPLTYEVYLTHKSSIALVAAHFDPKTYSKIDESELPASALHTCEHLRATAGLEGVPIAEFAQTIAKQHHFESKLQDTCALYSEMFVTMLDPSGALLIDDLELRNGLFVLTSQQNNASKDSPLSNNSDFWLLKVVHAMLKIQDGRLNDRNFTNILTPQLSGAADEKKHINGSISTKIEDWICRINANLVAMIVEKVLSFYRLRLDAFKISEMVEEEWLDITKIEDTNARREAVLHKLHIHKGDVQAAATAYTTMRPAGSNDCTALLIVDSDVGQSSVGSKLKQCNLDIDCAIIESVVHFEPEEPDIHNNDGTALAVQVCEDKDDDDEESVAREEFNRACQVVGWLAISLRKPLPELVEKCDALLRKLEQCKAFCSLAVKIYNEIKPMYDGEYSRLRFLSRAVRDMNEKEATVDQLALVRCSDPELVNRAYAAVSDEAVKKLSSVAYGFRPSLVRSILGPPSRWNLLISTVNADTTNIESAVAVIEKYKALISGSGVPTFFDFTERLTNYTAALTAYRTAKFEDDADHVEPIGLVNHNPRNSDLIFVKARIDAFFSQRDEWISIVLNSLDLSFKLAGAWAGLDNPHAKIVPVSRRTHTKIAISSILQMLTICEVKGALLITSDAAEFDSFRTGTSDNSSSCSVMAVLTGARRNIAFAHFDGLVAFASRSAADWKTICCLIEVAFLLLSHARTTNFDINSTAITREESTVFLHDDEQFVHIYEENRSSALEKIASLEADVETCYPTEYNWQFSDAGVFTAKTLQTLCATVPSILNQDTGFINYSGVKDRIQAKNGLFKIAEGKKMAEKESLHFELFFYDDVFGTANLPGNRPDIGSSSGSDPAHTPDGLFEDFDGFDDGLFGFAEPSAKSARLA